MMAENRLAADLDHILDHTRGLWDELCGERIFITGGTGFFGCWLLESFAWANDRLGLKARAVVLSRDPEAFRLKAQHLAEHPAIKFLRGDVRTFDFPKGTFSHVIHAATEASAKLNSENPLLMLDTIILGTRRTLDFSAKCLAQKLLLTSSGAIYGRQPADMSHIPEEYPGAPDPQDPRSAYGLGKRLSEHLCSLYAQLSALEMKIARGFAFVGPCLPLDVHFAIGNFIRDGLSGGPVVVKGDGTPLRSYLYSADLAIWLWTILFKGKPLRPYNVGSDHALSIGEIARLVAEQFGPGMRVEIRGRPSPGQTPERYVPDVQRARLELGLDSWVSLSVGIKRTKKYYEG